MKTNVVERNRSTTLSAAGGALAEATGITVGILGSNIDIVDNVSLAVRPGEIVGLVGESGSGKSTFGLSFLWHANRGLTIEAGSARIQETDLSALSARQLRSVRGRKVTYVPQDPARALNPSIRIGDQLKEVLTQSRSYKTSAEVDVRTRAVLGEVGLPPDDAFLRKFAHQLSGGQQQRVTLAMAFACRPALVVLDEPTTGLDVNVQKKVLSTVRELCERYEAGAIYVSHDLAVVASISDRVAVMYSGRIVECGPTLQILGEPRHPYTRSLLDAVPDHRAARRLRGYQGQRPLRRAARQDVPSIRAVSILSRFAVPRNLLSGRSASISRGAIVQVS